MNPLFGGGYGIGDVIRIYRQAKQNPGMLGNLLYQNGRIDQSQMEAMNGMDPVQMGQYLSQNKIMGPGFLQNGMAYANPVMSNLK
jgi:hypothetical protein